MKNEEEIRQNLKGILSYIGEDPEREGLRETPQRIIDSWQELFKGYKEDPNDLVKTFGVDGDRGIILLKNIELYSICEHHFLPFFGHCHIAYIPNDKIVGISKLTRIMEVYSRRLQTQERLNAQIADCLQDLLKPQGVAVMIEAEHFCMRARGVEKHESCMVTSSYRGIFLKDETKRDDFLKMIKDQGEV